MYVYLDRDKAYLTSKTPGTTENPAPTHKYNTEHIQGFH